MLADPCFAALRAHLETLLTGTSRVRVAYSGGLDSRVLLALACDWQQANPWRQLEVVHVHHGLNPQADRWATHCTEVCATYGIRCQVARVRVELAPRQSLEAVARQVRYAALTEAMVSGTALLTAHHQDDQVETLLLALKRGAGPRGLAAMPVSQPFAGGLLVRPLLETPRATLLALAERAGWQWVEDDSNQDVRFDRNFLRQQVLPQLNARWPGFTATAARSAALCAEQEALLEELAQRDLAGRVTPAGGLRLVGLDDWSLPRRHHLLRAWLRGQGAVMPEAEQLRRVWPEVVLARADATPCLQWGAQAIRRYDDALWLTPARLPAAPTSPAALVADQPLALPAGRLVVSAIQQGARLRAPRPGERVEVCFGLPGQTLLHPQGRGLPRSLKKLWHEGRVAPWLRAGWPVICYDGEVVAIPGLWVMRQAASPEGSGWQVQWWPTGSATPLTL